MNIFNLLRPDPPAPKIADQDKVKKAYRYWRLRIFYSIYAGYALYYFTRKSFAFVMPVLEGHLGYGKTELGFILSLLGISYAVSKLLNGVVADKANLRLLMSMGLILTGVCNLFCGFSSSITFFAVFIGINGLFQGWGAPPCAKLLTYWYSRKERGRWWGLWNTSHNLGGAVIPLVCAFTAHHLGWRYAFHLPGILAIFVGFILMNRLRDRPSTVGLPAIEIFRGDCEETDGTSKGKEEKALSSREILVEYVLKNKFIWLLGIAFFFVYIIRQIMNDWFMYFVNETRGYGLLAAGAGVALFEVGGALGALIAGWLSDTVFMGRRAPVNILFSLGILAALFAVWSIPAGNIWLLAGAMFLMGFFVFGPQMLIGMAAAELAHKEAAGTATGFVGFFAYLGGVVAGGPCGKIIATFGWSVLFRALGGCALITVFLLVPLLWEKVRTPAVGTKSAG
ncbi:MAG: phosphoglycerate transporter protein PgtP [Chlamydiota bacterium]